MQNKGTLYLIPTPLAENALDNTVVPASKKLIQQLDYFLVEDIRTARRFISSLKLGIIIEELKFEILNKKTSDQQVERILARLKTGKSIGLMSEAGCPGIADPGAKAVAKAHDWGCKVYPLTGPSSLFLALMASGFNGQQFSFHGYLPIKSPELARKIKELEDESAKKQQTQIFIEAPYRNQKLLQQLLGTLSPNTRLCVAKDLTGTDEQVISKYVKNWKADEIKMHKIPSIFLFQAG
jgi:16S rRNA (cytidine1402-2'-O)-methyltransferase